MGTGSKRAGYLKVDHRHSPGLPPEMAAAAGYIPSLAGAGGLFEADTKTCAHCNATVILHPLRTRARGYCASCDAYVCDRPGCGLDCRPFQKIIDDITGG